MHAFKLVLLAVGLLFVTSLLAGVISTRFGFKRERAHRPAATSPPQATPQRFHPG
jgi:hypothetical protein